MSEDKRAVSSAGDGERREGAAIAYIDLGVGGMTCDDCVVHVVEALESVPGVTKAIVDLESRSAFVETSADIVPGALVSAVRQSGGCNAFERGSRTRERPRLGATEATPLGCC